MFLFTNSQVDRCFCSKPLKWILENREGKEEGEGREGGPLLSEHFHQPSRLGFGHDRVWFSLFSKISETFLSSTVESWAVILQTQALPSGVSPAGVTVLGEAQLLRVSTGVLLGWPHSVPVFWDSAPQGHPVCVFGGEAGLWRVTFIS